MATPIKDAIIAQQAVVLNDNAAQEINPKDTRDAHDFGWNAFTNVVREDLANTPILNSHISDNAVTTSKIVDTAVSESKLATSSVSSVKIKAANVQTAAIKDLNVTLPKLSQPVQDLLLAVGGGSIVNNPDDEDLESVASQLKFKDRTNSGNQLGYKIIRSNFDFTNIPVGYDNSFWEIRYEHDLLGASFTFPSNVTLEHLGGVFTNYGTITLDNTTINHKGGQLFDASGAINGAGRAAIVTPKIFGVDINSGNDEAAGLLAAKELSNICNVDLSLDGGTYKSSLAIETVGYNTGIVGQKGSSRIDFSDYVGTPNVIKLSGNVFDLETYSISANVSKGDNQITFNGVHGLSIGDVFVINNSDDYSFSTNRPEYNEGEFCEVKKVISTTIVELRYSVSANYAVGVNIDIYKAYLAKIKLQGFECIVPSTAQGVRLERCIDIDVLGLKIEGSQVNQMSVSNCYKGTVSDLQLYENNVAIGLNYGLSIGNCQSLGIHTIHSSTTRHGCTMGGGATSAFPYTKISLPNRFVRVYHSFFGLGGSGGLMACDMHGNCEFCYYEDNYINGGVVLGGRNIGAKRNEIKSAPDGIAVLIASYAGGKLDIVGNDIEQSADLADLNSRGLIDINIGSDVNIKGTINVKGNTIDRNNKLGYWLRSFKSGGVTVDLNINASNEVLNTPSTSYHNCIIQSSTGVANSHYDSIIVKNNILNGAGVWLREALYKYANVSVNDFIEPKGKCLSSTQNSNATPDITEGFLLFQKNTCLKPYGLPVSVTGQLNISGSCKISENTFINPNDQAQETSSSQKGSIYAVNLDFLEFSKNTVIDSAGNMSYKYYISSSVLKSSVFGNNYHGAPLVVTNDSPEINTGFIMDETSVSSYGIAAPVSGTWARGDKVFNASPNAGEYEGWICVTTGTPGTWKGFGLIEA